MKRIKLEVAYDGSSYHGWQVQANGITIEEVLNRELTRLLKEEIAVIGASRTDAGVHALGNVAVFDSDTKIPPKKICLALNQGLPKDIVVQYSEEVPMDFHPRYTESEKTYAYHILNRKVNLPHLRKYAYFVHAPLDVDKMREASAYLVGRHDFASFSSVGRQTKTTVRTIFSIDIDKVGDRIEIRIRGNGFLYNMVRIIVGTLVLVGDGRWRPEQMYEALIARNRESTGPTAPPHGLMLENIMFS